MHNYKKAFWHCNSLLFIQKLFNKWLSQQRGFWKYYNLFLVLLILNMNVLKTMLIRRRLVVLYMIFPTVTVVEFCLKKKDGHQGITFHYKYIAGLSRDNQLVTPLQFSWSARFISACIRQCRWRPSKGLCAPLQSLTHCGYTGVLIVLPPTPTFRLPSSAKVANQRHHNTESLRLMALNCLQKRIMLLKLNDGSLDSGKFHIVLILHV